MRHIQQSLETICLEYRTVCPFSNPSVDGAEGYNLKSWSLRAVLLAPVSGSMLPRTVWVWWKAVLGEGSWGPPAAPSRKVSQLHHSLVLPCPSSLGSAVGSCWPCLRQLHPSGLAVEGGLAEVRGDICTTRVERRHLSPTSGLKQWSRGIKLNRRQMWFLL